MSVQLIDGDQVFSVDAVLTENHTYASRVTAYPVEEGGSISDHITNEQPSVSVTGFITNTPVELIVEIDANTPLDRITDLVAQGIYRRPSGRSAADAFTALMQLRDSRKPVTLITNLPGIRRYPNMALVNLSFPVDKNTGTPKRGIGGALNFTAEFKQIRLVHVGAESVPARAQVMGDAGKRKAIAGKQVLKPAATAQESKQVEQRARSVLKGLGDGVRKAFQ